LSKKDCAAISTALGQEEKDKEGQEEKDKEKGSIKWISCQMWLVNWLMLFLFFFLLIYS